MALVSRGPKSKTLVSVCSDKPLWNLWQKTKGQMGLQKERKGQESHMEIYPPEKGISPFVKASSLHPEDLKLGSLS